MDKVEHYRSLIEKILTEYHQQFSQAASPEVEMLLAFDEARDQYLWFQVGWTSEERIKGISVHIRIKNEKIYIEEDWTEEGIANELLREGVPKEDIVLAFHDPESRKLTDFAVA
ncbi:XisI protein [Lusitaniella coriacea LEGE 07157]|uniref:XisI protein n=1 Tax=Lusitaniella coriacea LEGE 07157 TaxID=945747 RepID=A0A8J7B8U5_9CYAN|nr:XisI protein [Lusitaniella coriacea]MBE9115168.1 XisI protein [Lusitaniella coriacea LEGE 07157]